jgi:hypothetical protein
MSLETYEQQIAATCIELLTTKGEPVKDGLEITEFLNDSPTAESLQDEMEDVLSLLQADIIRNPEYIEEKIALLMQLAEQAQQAYISENAHINELYPFMQINTLATLAFQWLELGRLIEVNAKRE